MEKDKETRKKLLSSAKAEFSEKGFMKASLRSICKNAGVTTGALYFFFKDKDDLFVSVVKEPFEKIEATMNEHFRGENDSVEKGEFLDHDSMEDMKASLEIIKQMYQYREELLLVLTKSQGSSMEHVVDEFIEAGKKHNRVLADEMSRQTNRPLLDENILHWITYMQVDIFVYMITHIETEQEAIAYMEHVAKYMVSGWFGMFGIDRSTKR